MGICGNGENNSTRIFCDNPWPQTVWYYFQDMKKPCDRDNIFNA